MASEPSWKTFNTLKTKARSVLRAVTSKNGRRVIIIFSVSFFMIFSVYIYYLFNRLEAAFEKRGHFLPTVIYSDVTLIRPPHSKQTILSRLSSLGYPFIEDEDRLQFVLRKMDYPEYLIPQDHPTFDLEEKPIELLFDGTDENSLLISIRAENLEYSEIFLEPEIIARLSRTGESGNKQPDQIRDYVPFESIPARVWQAIIAVEDRHFLDHPGLDLRAFVRAQLVNLRSLSWKQGGSTITQQLVKNLMVRRTKNVFKKINEIFLSLILETRYSKEKILERYLNEVYLGQIGNLEIHGVAEGARYFFGKSLDQLNLAEIALIAGIIRGPGFYSPYRNWDRAIGRQNFVLKKMVETAHLSPEEAERAKNLPIRLSPPPRAANRAPYFTDYVKAELIQKLEGRLSEQEITNVGFKVYTTLDPHMNDLAQEAVRTGVVQLNKQLKKKPTKETPEEKTNEIEGALASVDHRTGYIRALVGGSDYKENDIQSNPQYEAPGRIDVQTFSVSCGFSKWIWTWLSYERRTLDPQVRRGPARMVAKKL